MSAYSDAEQTASPPAEPAQENSPPPANSAPLEEKLKAVMESYRALVRRSNPDILPEMISGESPEEIEQSLAKARELVERLKTRLEEKAKEVQVPVGSTARDVGGEMLTPEEKIRRGIR